MNEKNVPKLYWAEVGSTTVYLMNTCTTSGVHDVTHHEKFFGKKPNLFIIDHMVVTRSAEW